MTPEEFHNLVIDKIGTCRLYTNQECPDVFLERIQGAKFDKRKPSHSRKKDKPCIILIMESPHILEFHGDDIGPAQGKTGEHIERYFDEIIARHNINVNAYDLILFNAIPFQCSLGEPTNTHRYSVFVKTWKEGARNYFNERLKNIINHPNDIIINACTKINNHAPLYRFVQQAIDELANKLANELNFQVNKLRNHHPFSWIKEDYRKPLLLDDGIGRQSPPGHQ